MAGVRQTYCCSLRGISDVLLYRSGSSFLKTRGQPFAPRLIPLGRDPGGWMLAVQDFCHDAEKSEEVAADFILQLE